MNHPVAQSGFSLVELMIVVAIAAIIAAIAIPSFQDQVASGKRAEGRTEIVEVAQALERCYTRFSVYNNAACPIVPIITGAGQDSEEAHYTVTGQLTPQTFNLTATPNGAHANYEGNPTKGCGNLTLNQTGLRGKTGGEAIDRCW